MATNEPGTTLPRYTVVRRTITSLRNPNIERRGMIMKRLQLTASPATVYRALLDSTTMSEVTGLPAEINPIMGGDYSALDGYLSGVVSELLEDRHIAIACRVQEDGWPETHLSTATFMVKPEGSGTNLSFFQQDVPADYHELMLNLWEQYFWSKLPAAFT